MSIPNVTPYTGGVPVRGQKLNFNTYMAQVAAYIATYHTSHNASVAAINDLIPEISAAAQAASLANYAGLWSGLTGALAFPASTYHTGEPWMLLEDVADVTSEEPGVSTKWAAISEKTGVNVTSSAVDFALTAASRPTQKITFSAADKFVTEVDATLLPKGYERTWFNTGNYRHGIKDSAGGFLASIDAKSFGRLKLIDNSTAAGTWEAIDGADLIMATLKTVCNAEAVSDITQCNLTVTDVFIAFKADSKGKAVVLKLGATITPSNILTFETGAFAQPFATRNSNTVAMVTYQGPDSDGWIAAITYNGTDTIATTHKYEFKNNASVLHPKHDQITSALVGVIYYDSEGTAGIRGQVLNWTGSEFTANTADTQLLTTANAYADIATISGSASAAKIFLLERGASTASYIVSWDGTSISIGSTGTQPQSAHTFRSVIMIDITYALSLSFITSTYDHVLELWDVSGATPVRRIAKFLPAEVPGMSSAGMNMMALMGSGEVLIIRPIWGGLEHKIYKLKVVGASSSKNCVLNIVSEFPLKAWGAYPCIASTDGSTAVAAIMNYETSSFLAVEKVSMA